MPPCARFHIVKPAARCSVVTTDQDTGETSADIEPLGTLQTFRTGAQVKGWSSELQADRVFFGTYLVAEGAGGVGHEEDPAAPTTVAVGAKVVVTNWRRTSKWELLSATCEHGTPAPPQLPEHRNRNCHHPAALRQLLAAK